MFFGSLLQSFGNLGRLRCTDIKIQEEAGCQSLSVEVHADTCGRDPNVLKPLQWCSLGSSERFVFISSCKCLLTGRSCCTIMIQCRAAETLCARGYIQQRRCRSPGCAKLTLFVCDPKNATFRMTAVPGPSTVFNWYKIYKGWDQDAHSSDTQRMLTWLVF